MEEEDRNKEVDLMEQVGNIKYDENAYFELCREHVLEAIKEVSFMTDDLALFDKLLKYFDLSFSKEIQNIILGKYDRDPLINYSAEQKNKIVAAIQELKKQKYFYYDDYSNRLCGNMPFMHSKWLINENSFGITLCNVIKACHLFKFYGDKKRFIESIAEILKDFYKIYPDNNAEFGYRVIPNRVIQKYNIEIIKSIENEPSLQNVMKYYYQNDIGKALAELRKITEFSSKKNTEFTKFIQSQSTDLQEMCKKVYKFITTYENHIAENANATDKEARIWFDLGLSIYRLYLMNSK